MNSCKTILNRRVLLLGVGILLAALPLVLGLRTLSTGPAQEGNHDTRFTAQQEVAPGFFDEAVASTAEQAPTALSRDRGTDRASKRVRASGRSHTDAKLQAVNGRRAAAVGRRRPLPNSHHSSQIRPQNKEMIE